MVVSKKLLSIIIPVHNAEQWVSQTLDSVLAQTYPNVEVICIDDGSTDGSFDILCSYAGEHSSIRIYRRQLCSGISVARIMVIKEEFMQLIVVFVATFIMPWK